MAEVKENKEYYTDLSKVDSKSVYNQLPEYTRIARYAQYNKSKKRRETWMEQTDRVFKMHKVKFQKHLENPEFMKEFNFAKEMVQNKHVLGSQRALQFGGPAILNKETRMYNCFSADTRFWTDNGIRSFNQFQDGDVVNVRTHKKWSPAIVRRFGNEELLKLTVEKQGVIHEIFTTSNHRWISKSNRMNPFEIKTTIDLNRGDFLQKFCSNPISFEKCPIGIQHGIVFGKGTYYKIINNCRVQLTGDNAELRRFFSNESKDNTVINLPSIWKDLPSLDINKEYLYGFISGWFSVNGTINRETSTLLMTSANKQSLEWLQTALFKLGVMTGKINMIKNYDLSEKYTFQVSIERDLLMVNFFINSKHSTRYIQPDEGQWQVLTIETTERREDVWCVVEPESEEFTLENGIVTKNCCASYIDRTRVFQEIMFSLLCGVGVGFSVQIHHIDKLPSISPISDVSVTYKVPDSIEGWSDAIGILCSSYFSSNQPFPEYFGKNVEFDFSLIRPAGAHINNIGGKAPGPNGLSASIKKIKEIFENCLAKGLTKLRPIDAYDIVVHSSDAVLSGGIRRSATIALFSLEDEEMIKAKTGDWYIKNPQRARSNNSVLLLRDSTPEKSYMDLIESVKQFGEPGVIWADNKETLYNPCCEISLYGYDKDGNSGFQFCVSGDTNLITKTGRNKIIDVIGKNVEIWNGKKWCNVKPFETAKNTDLHRVSFSDGSYLDCTLNHKFKIKHRFMKEYTEVTTKDIINLIRTSKYKWNVPKSNVIMNDDNCIQEMYSYEYGFITGDNFSEKNNFESFANKYESKKNPFNNSLNNNFIEKIKAENSLPEEVFSWTRNSIINFISGWIDSQSHNDSDCRLYGTETKMRDVQLLISKAGIYSKLRKEGDSDIWYCRIYDTKSLKTKTKFIPSQKEKYQSIKWVEKLNGIHDTYCLEEKNEHMCMFNNVMTMQCNLTEINMASVSSPAEFYERCEAASILGTLQAAYTNFGYLGEVTKSIVKREALLGVSMTGMMDSPDISFNPQVLEKGANIVKQTNERVAKIIGINRAARTTCIKPAGSTSCILGTSSGIHPCHSRRYFRRVQSNNLEGPLKFFKSHNPQAVESSVWSAGKTDDVITFLCKSKPNALTKSDVSAIDLLEKVKLVQKHWVTEGKNVESCAQPWLNHNVSNTITIKDNEWESAAKFIYNNKDYFAGISMLGDSGDMTYHQAPFQAVYTHEEITKMYGAGSVFASGLIVHANDAFDNNLYSACATLMGYGEKLEMPNINSDDGSTSLIQSDKIYKKIRWVAQAKKFAKRHFGGDLLKMTFCLKAVDSWKNWCDLKRTYKTIPWEEFLEEEDNTKPTEYVACSGNSCEIIRF